jgi:hypothetical protein
VGVVVGAEHALRRDIARIVDGEYHENEMRKNFSVSERVAIGKTLETVTPERRGRPTKNVEKVPQYNGDSNTPKNGEKTRETAARQAGFGSSFAYEQAKKVIDEGVPSLVQMVDGKCDLSHVGMAVGPAHALRPLPGWRPDGWGRPLQEEE